MGRSSCLPAVHAPSHVRQPRLDAAHSPSKGQLPCLRPTCNSAEPQLSVHRSSRIPSRVFRQGKALPREAQPPPGVQFDTDAADCATKPRPRTRFLIPSSDTTTAGSSVEEAVGLRLLRCQVWGLDPSWMASSSLRLQPRFRGHRTGPRWISEPRYRSVLL